MYTKKKTITKQKKIKKTRKITLRISKNQPSTEGKNKIKYIKQIVRI